MILLMLILLLLLFHYHIATLEVDLMHKCGTRCFHLLIHNGPSFWRSILLVAAAGHRHVEEGHVDDVARSEVGFRLLQILLFAERGGLAHALILLAEVAKCVRPQKTALPRCARGCRAMSEARSRLSVIHLQRSLRAFIVEIIERD